MPLWEGFIGGAYRAMSPWQGAETCVNLYLEVTETANAVKHAFLYGTPGMKSYATVATAECRGCFSQDGVTLVTVGANVYSVDTTLATTTLLGTIPDDGNPVSYACNGRGGEQIAIVGGGQLKILDLLTMTLSGPIVLPLTNAPVVIRFINGYFVLLEADTIRVWFSTLEDGTMWDALDFFARSDASDNLVGLEVLRDRVWLFGSQTSEIYYNGTDTDNPFVPYPGTLMQEGAVTAWGITVQTEAIYWLAADNQGRNRMVSATDPAPTVISTPPISFALAGYTTTTDAEVLAYEQNGHPFVIWTFPSGDQTWAYDVREQAWHQRDQWDINTGQSHRWRARGVCASENLILVGDYQTGVLSTLDLSTYQDNSLMIRRSRRAPYLSGENQWLFLDRFELGVQTGVGLATGQGSAPQLLLSISRTSTAAFDPPIAASLGAMGDYDSFGATWYQLGRARGDRLVVEVVQTDPVLAAWGPGAWIRVRPGSGQL